MKGNSLQNNGKMLFLVFLGSMLIFGMLITGAKMQTEETEVIVVPEKQEVGGESVQLPESFYVDINIADVSNLFGWQIKLYYSPRILNLTDATYPPGHIFEGKDPMELPVQNETWTKELVNDLAVNLSEPEGTIWTGQNESPMPPTIPKCYNITRWVDKDGSGTLSSSDIIFLDPMYPQYISYYRVDWITFGETIITLRISMAYCFFGGQLLPPEASFNGSGALFRLTFDALRPGISFLNISTDCDTGFYDSLLLDYDEEDINMERIDGSLQVFGIPAEKDTSYITIKAEPTLVDVGANVTLTGRINPARPGANLTIYYKSEGEATWIFLTQIETDLLSSYNYTWKNLEAGVYELKANWTGDQLTKASESATVKVTVGEEPPPPIDYLLYIVVAAVIICIVAVVLYFTKIRKH